MATKIKKADIPQLRNRMFESDLIQYRNFRVDSMGFNNWKDRLAKVDALYRGDWAEVFGDESTEQQNPHVMNMVQVGLNDMAVLATESVPTVRCLPDKETQSAEDKANVREAILDTYWQINNGHSLVPRLAMDIAGAGIGILVAYPDKNSDYPCVQRIDPRYAYPDVRNGRVQDLLVVETMNVRVAWRLFPDLVDEPMPTVVNETVEIIHYYSEQECLQAVSWQPLSATRTGGKETTTLGERQAVIVNRWNPVDSKGNPYIPVAFVQLDSFDGQFRGLFDQVLGSLKTKDRIVKQMVDYTDRFVYASLTSKGLLNPTESPGPRAHFRLDPMIGDAHVGYLEPPGPAPAIFNILEFLDKENRGGVGYPSTRQGEVEQSQGSGSFVNSTQGQLSSVVRNIQRLIAILRQDINTIWMKMDETLLDHEKALVRPIGQKVNYLPSRDIDGHYQNTVIYGATAGFSRLEGDVRVQQMHGNKIISLDTAREQVPDFIPDPRAEGAKVDLEATQDAFMQKLFAEGSVQDLQTLIIAQMEGKSLLEAMKALQASQAAAAAPQGAGELPPGTPGAPPPGGDMSAIQGALAGQKGAVPGQPAPGGSYSPPPPPQTQIQINSPSPGRAFSPTGGPA